MHLLSITDLTHTEQQFRGGDETTLEALNNANKISPHHNRIIATKMQAIGNPFLAAPGLIEGRRRTTRGVKERVY